MTGRILTAELLLEAYGAGIFPMGETADDPSIYWVEPKLRGVIPLDGFHLPKRLRRTLRQAPFEIRIDHDFDAVIAACAGEEIARDETWINATIRDLYGELFRRGQVHTVECWQEGRLVGGLYGVRLGGAFFGESMFHRVTDASKVALAHLVARLRAGGFVLLDAQFQTAHLARFGAVEVPRRRYLAALAQAITVPADWAALPRDAHADAAKILALLPVAGPERGR
jgi:leucyl/phenylalanyl-tRNA--protein transferase